MKKTLLGLYIASITSCLNAAQPQAAKPAPVKEPHSTASKFYTIDTILATVMNEEGTEIITLSDTQRPSLSGATRSLDDMVFELLVFLDAKKHKISPDDDAVEKYLENVQKSNDLTRDQLEEIFIQSGYTLDEGRTEFKKMQANNIMIEHEIKSKLVVPRRKIEKYFEENPETVEEEYELQRTVIPFDPQVSKDVQLKEITEQLTSSCITTPIVWEQPFWVIKSELAQEKSFISTLAIGTVAIPQVTELGFELFRLKDKHPERLKTIEERYTDIANILRRPRYMQLVDEYKEKLFATSSVQYL